MMRRGLSDEYGFWNTYWIFIRCSIERCLAKRLKAAPPRRISPVHSWCSPPIDLDSVVLPDPDSPTRARHSPVPTWRLMPWTTSLPPYDADTLSTTKAASTGGALVRVAAAGGSADDRLGPRSHAPHGVTSGDLGDCREGGGALVDGELATRRKRASLAVAGRVTEHGRGGRRSARSPVMSGAAAMRWRE